MDKVQAKQLTTPLALSLKNLYKKLYRDQKRARALPRQSWQLTKRVYTALHLSPNRMVLAARRVGRKRVAEVFQWRNKVAALHAEVESIRHRLYQHVTQSELQLDRLRPQGSNGIMDFFAEKLASFGIEVTGDDLDKHMHITSACLVFLIRSQNWMDVMHVANVLSIHFLNKPVVAALMESLFSTGEAQSMDFTILKDLLAHYEAIKKHPVVIKVMTLVSLAFSSGILAKLGVDGEAADLWKMAQEGIAHIVAHTDFIAAVLDLFHFIVERVAAFVSTGSWKSLFHSPRSYAAWTDSVFLLLEQQVALSNPSAIGIDYHDYVKRLEQAIKDGSAIKAYLKDADDRDVVSSLLSKLRGVQNDILIKKACAETRMVPFSLLLSAGSGVGKSSFMRLLMFHYAKLFNKSTDADCIYTRTAKEPHWNNFKTHQWACILDDIASTNPNTCSDDPSLTDLLHVVNNVAFSPPQADLADKGRTPFKCEFVVATTNTENLMAHAWFNNPQAVRRRLPLIIRIKPKEEYRKAGTEMLDSEKVPPLVEGEYDDLWEIEVVMLKVTAEQQIAEEPVLKTNDIYVFAAEFAKLARQHRVNQNKVMHAEAMLARVQLCPIHDIPKSKCPCDDGELRLQGDEEQPLWRSLATAGLAAAGVYGSYKACKFTATCAGEVLNAQPDLLKTPGLLAAKTCHRMGQKAQRFVKKQALRFEQMSCDMIKAYLHGKLLDVYNHYSPMLKRIALFVGGLVAAGLSYKMYRSFFPAQWEGIPQVALEEAGKRPTSKGDEVENVWRKDDYEPSKFMGRLAQAWKDMSLPSAAKIVSQNVVWCKTKRYTTNSGSKFRALCVGGCLYVTDNHVMLEDVDEFEMQVIHENSSRGCNGNVTFTMRQSDIYRLPEAELAFFEICHMPNRRNLEELFPVDFGARADAPGTLVRRMDTGAVDYNECRRVHVLPEPVNAPALGRTLKMAQCFLTRDTQDGDCGCPVVVKQPNGVLLAGIHVLGGADCLGMAVMVTQKQIAEAREALKAMYPVDVAEPKVGENFSKLVSQKCVFRYMEQGDVQVYGSFTGFKQQPKSTVKPTLLAPALKARGHIQQFGPAPMKGYMPVRLAALDMVNKKYVMKRDVLEKCRESFEKDILDHLPQKFKDELADVLDMHSALNGVPGVRFIDSMNFSTSAGFPHNKTKRHFLLSLPADEIWNEPITLTSEMRAEVEEMWDNMMEGRRCAPIFMQHLKNEALPWAKVKAGKSRVFMGAPFSWSVCVRMLFLPFVRVLQLNKYLFESAPGTNATSIEWTRMYQYLSAFGETRCIAGDFRAFDKNMGSLVILLAFAFIINISRACGMREQYLRAMWTVAYDTAFAFCNYNGDLVQFFGSNPSGHPLTVIINCIVNCLYMRYCYYELNPEKEIGSFKSNVRLMVYGDDNESASRVEWFNHTAIANTLESIGIGYTMADKTAESVPFIPLSEVSFLKRTYRFEPELNCHTSPLDEKSIWKMLMVCVPSTSESAEAQCISIVTSAVSEWFHYGRDRFNEEVPKLRKVVEESGLLCYVEEEKVFPSWDKLAQRFVKSSLDYLKHEPETTVKILGRCTWQVPSKYAPLE